VVIQAVEEVDHDGKDATASYMFFSNQVITHLVIVTAIIRKL
jgi:hypothetical protein